MRDAWMVGRIGVEFTEEEQGGGKIWALGRVWGRRGGEGFGKSRRCI